MCYLNKDHHVQHSMNKDEPEKNTKHQDRAFGQMQ